MWRSKALWLTRHDVAQLLGIDRSKVRRMQDAGELRFLRDERGICRFPREQIELLAANRGLVLAIAPGPVTAKSFELFALGKTWQEVVIDLGRAGMGQPSDVVRALHAQFLDRDAKARLARPRAFRRTDGIVPVLAPELELPDDANDNNDENDLDEETLAADSDLDAWQREQDELHRRAQQAFDDEQRAWDEERQRKRAASAGPRLARPPPDDEPVPISVPISAELLRLLQIAVKKGP